MITRFAPSPTGPLHLGHAYAALVAYDMAQAAGGQFLLRIEDIDRSRARPQWEAQITEDLSWLGLSWPAPVMRQSDRLPAYHAALARLWDRGLLYACTCNRRDILEAASAPQEGAPQLGPDGILYPGTCRPNTAPSGAMPQGATLRLNLQAAFEAGAVCKEDLQFCETGAGPEGETGEIAFTPDEALRGLGDVVLARRDMASSYHLSVVVDDAAQGITHVTRGADLFEATKIHVIMQTLLDLPRPIYHHHALIRDAAGKRLAKRDDARALSRYRAEGKTPADIRAMLALDHPV